MNEQDILKGMLEKACVYLDHIHKEQRALLMPIDKEGSKVLTSEERIAATRYQFEMALLLDLIHTSYPKCYDLFPANKQNFDDILKIHHLYQKTKVLKPCPCDLCKDVEIDKDPEEPKDAVEQQS